MVDPAAMTIIDVLCAPKEIGDPTDIAFSKRELQRGESFPEGCPDEIDKRVDGSG